MGIDRHAMETTVGGAMMEGRGEELVGWEEVHELAYRPSCH